MSTERRHLDSRPALAGSAGDDLEVEHILSLSKLTRQAAILAVGEAVRQPVVHDDQVTIATIMMLTLSIDHRAVDGAAAVFLTRLKELIEEPLDIVL
jgi:hypothetical protein